MKKKYKKIYVEITNICNLSCEFCLKSNREDREMTICEFEKIVNKIKPYTDYINLHVKGEPLLHSNLEEILNICSNNDLKVVITTNGTLIMKQIDTLLKFDSIFRINFSIHSIENEKYLENILKCSDQLIKKEINVSYRFWANTNNKMSKKDNMLFQKVLHYYNIDNINLEKSYKIKKHLYINMDDIFTWPDLNNSLYEEEGTCMALNTHIGILSNGDVIPCCLDHNALINMGNILTQDMDTIINSELYKNMEDGFLKNRKIHKLCQHCDFYKKRSN